MSWQIIYTPQARQDAKKLAAAGLKDNAQQLLDALKKDPLHPSPSCKKLTGDLTGAYSRRINIQHRLSYQVLNNEKHVKILRLWSHYG